MRNDISLGTLGQFVFAGAILVIVACSFYTVDATEGRCH
jgi:hypothetical protein